MAITQRIVGMNEQIEELIQKGKLQRYVKKGKHSSFKKSNKNQSEFTPGGNDRPHQPPHDVIGEIQTISRGPLTEGSFRSLRKAT